MLGRRLLVPAILAGILMFLSAAPAVAYEGADGAVAARQTAPCKSRMALKPHAEYHVPPIEHRNWLEPTKSYNASTYVVVNLDTGEAHQEWLYWNNRFYVNTSYSWTHPLWYTHSWVLLYDC
jgi:hypothetical protein